MGTNEFMYSFEVLLNTLKQSNTNCRVAVMSIPLRHDNVVLNSLVIKVNKLLSRLCKCFEVEFLTYNHLNTSYYATDLFHLNKYGKETVASKIVSFLSPSFLDHRQSPNRKVALNGLQ